MAPQPYDLQFVNPSSDTSISFRLPSLVSRPRSPFPSKNMLIKVSQIKEKVEEKEGIPPVQQRLIYGGKQMQVSLFLSPFNLALGEEDMILEERATHITPRQERR
ncbi:hypothetical protein B2J93_531 [Marssonina coronariae]|uniref:Ubiquitin-like domain-containing protein n=1 Tax=Diplocarpon coronariae TaxID=2795749 RepID=A0A218YYZ7_9HELO|nr:hypothetical protein B2J93_531 [Marssonina coronariae]